MRVLSHDAFARVEYLRESVHLEGVIGRDTCAWCGGAGRNISKRRRVLYRYGYQKDGLTTSPKFENLLFCSKECHDLYWH